MTNLEMFNAKGILLQQEGYLFSSCLMVGSSNLQRADLDNKGEFYSAFFQLSIGLERLMKVIYIVEYMAKNQLNTPSSKQVSVFSHNLDKLFETCSNFASTYQVSGYDDLADNSISQEILNVLSGFAKKQRYHNLDSIGDEKGLKDPLSQWQHIIDRIVEADIPQSEVYKAQMLGTMWGVELSENSTFIYNDLNQESPPPDKLITNDLLIKLAAPYCLHRIFAILSSLYELLRYVTELAQSIELEQENELVSVPCMYEFLEFAVYPDPELWQLPA